MRGEQEIVKTSAGAAQHGHQCDYHGKQAHCAQRHRQSNFEQGRPRAQSRDQDDLRRRGPHQDGRKREPARRKAGIVCERADAQIGAGENQHEH